MMNSRKFRYSSDTITKTLTLLHFILFTAVAGVLYLFFDGGYMFAWFVSIAIAIVMLMLLSIPRYVVLNSDSIDICCISDYTHIDFDKIAYVRIVKKGSMRYMLPIFAAIGFFGYYGLFLNLRKMDFVKIYASKIGESIEITDIYEDKYYITCDNLSELYEHLNSVTNHNADEL